MRWVCWISSLELLTVKIKGKKSLVKLGVNADAKDFSE